MQRYLAQVMERREPPSDYAAGGTETHPAAGRLISVDSLSSPLFPLHRVPRHCLTVLRGCGNMGTGGDRRARPEQRLVWEKFFSNY